MRKCLLLPVLLLTSCGSTKNEVPEQYVYYVETTIRKRLAEDEENYNLEQEMFVWREKQQYYYFEYKINFYIYWNVYYAVGKISDNDFSLVFIDI